MTFHWVNLSGQERTCNADAVSFETAHVVFWMFDRIVWTEHNRNVHQLREERD